MRLTSHIQLLLLAAWLPQAAAHAQVSIAVLQPTPTCAPDYIDARFDPDYGPEPTYYPGDRFPLHLVPVDLEDWPTTPSYVGWHTSIADRYFQTTDTLYTVVIPDPAPDTVEVFAWISVPDIRPECGYWSTHDVWFTARRFDYNPTPSPTPSPPPTATPEPTPIDCDYYIINPPNASLVTTSTVVIELRTDTPDTLTFQGLETTVGGNSHPVVALGGNRWLAMDLMPQTSYVWYYGVNYHYDMSQGKWVGTVCLNYFHTSAFAPLPPTPTPAPTAVPTATPSLTPTASPTATEPPPTPTALPTPPPGANGWVVCQRMEKFI